MGNNKLNVLLFVLMIGLTGCLEQGAEQGNTLPSTGGGAMPSQPSANPPPYTGELLTVIPSQLSDSTLWYYSASDTSVGLISTNSSATYSSNNPNAYASVNTKFKMLGDTNNNGALSISGVLHTTEGITSSFYFDFSTNYSKCLFVKTYYHDGFLDLYIGTKNGGTDTPILNVTYSPTGTKSLPFSMVRDQNGVVTVTVDGNLLTFAGYSGDVDLSSVISGSGTLTFDTWNVSQSSYAVFGGH